MYRLLLSSASSMVSHDLFEPGTYSADDAFARADQLKPHLGGVEVYVLHESADPREVLKQKGWV